MLDQQWTDAPGPDFEAFLRLQDVTASDDGEEDVGCRPGDERQGPREQATNPERQIRLASSAPHGRRRRSTSDLEDPLADMAPSASSEMQWRTERNGGLEPSSGREMRDQADLKQTGGRGSGGGVQVFKLEKTGARPIVAAATTRTVYTFGDLGRSMSLPVNGRFEVQSQAVDDCVDNHPADCAAVQPSEVTGAADGDVLVQRDEDKDKDHYMEDSRDQALQSQNALALTEVEIIPGLEGEEQKTMMEKDGRGEGGRGEDSGGQTVGWGAQETDGRCGRGGSGVVQEVSMGWASAGGERGKSNDAKEGGDAEPAEGSSRGSMETRDSSEWAQGSGEGSSGREKIGGGGGGGKINRNELQQVFDGDRLYWAERAGSNGSGKDAAPASEVTLNKSTAGPLDEEDGLSDKWAQCESCEKWRRLPGAMKVDESANFVCSNLKFVTCETTRVEDSLAEDEDDVSQFKTICWKCHANTRMKPSLKRVARCRRRLLHKGPDWRDVERSRGAREREEEQDSGAAPAPNSSPPTVRKRGRTGPKLVSSHDSANALPAGKEAGSHGKEDSDTESDDNADESALSSSTSLPGCSFIPDVEAKTGRGETLQLEEDENLQVHSEDSDENNEVGESLSLVFHSECLECGEKNISYRECRLKLKHKGPEKSESDDEHDQDFQLKGVRESCDNYQRGTFDRSETHARSSLAVRARARTGGNQSSLPRQRIGRWPSHPLQAVAGVNDTYNEYQSANRGRNVSRAEWEEAKEQLWKQFTEEAARRNNIANNSEPTPRVTEQDTTSVRNKTTGPSRGDLPLSKPSRRLPDRSTSPFLVQVDSACEPAAEDSLQPSPGDKGQKCAGEETDGEPNGRRTTLHKSKTANNAAAVADASGSCHGDNEEEMMADNTPKFQSCCKDCYQKKTGGGKRRCRVQLGHEEPDWRDDDVDSKAERDANDIDVIGGGDKEEGMAGNPKFQSRCKDCYLQKKSGGKVRCRNKLGHEGPDWRDDHDDVDSEGERDADDADAVAVASSRASHCDSGERFSGLGNKRRRSESIAAASMNKSSKHVLVNNAPSAVLSWDCHPKGMCRSQMGHTKADWKDVDPGSKDERGAGKQGKQAEQGHGVPAMKQDTASQQVPVDGRAAQPTFKSICWECKYGKFVIRKNTFTRCRQEKLHTGPDWRDVAGLDDPNPSVEQEDAVRVSVASTSSSRCKDSVSGIKQPREEAGPVAAAPVANAEATASHADGERSDEVQANVQRFLLSCWDCHVAKIAKTRCRVKMGHTEPDWKVFDSKAGSSKGDGGAEEQPDQGRELAAAVEDGGLIGRALAEWTPTEVCELLEEMGSKFTQARKVCEDEDVSGEDLQWFLQDKNADKASNPLYTQLGLNDIQVSRLRLKISRLAGE